MPRFSLKAIGAYRDHDVLFVEAAWRHLRPAGFMLQVDDAFMASYYDVLVPPGTLEDYRRWAEIRIVALNLSLKGIPPEQVRHHVCWGSWSGPHVSDVPLKSIVDLLIKANAGAYALEMANPRHEHEWVIWQDVEFPERKILLTGVISHSTNVVEHPELVAQRTVDCKHRRAREHNKRD